MLNENAKKWVAALRSGKYAQTKEVLRSPHGYCCLGVACEIALQNGVKLAVGKLGDTGDTTYNGEHTYLPKAVIEWLGLEKRTGRYYSIEGVTGLADQNDTGRTFSEIADIIESEPEGLFVVCPDNGNSQ